MVLPGRILVIDDVPEEVVKIIDSLRQDGENVVSTTSVPDDAFLENVRLLIIDLYLVGNDKDSSYEIVTSIFEKISEKTTFFIIAIWTKIARNTDRDKQIITELQSLYKKKTETDLNAVFLEPFGKSISQIELVKRVKDSIASRPECGLLLEIERSIESARDRAVSDLIGTASVSVILKALRNEIGEVALDRHMIGLYLKVLARHCESSKTMTECVRRLITQLPSTPVNKYGHMHNLQSYYDIPRNELIWTGDVLERKDDGKKYVIIISPACDFAQRKKRPLDYMKIVPASRINHSDLTDLERLREIKTTFKIKAPLEEIPRAVLTGAYLQKRFYSLPYLEINHEGILFHLVLDFQQVSSLPFKETADSLEEEGWVRICRVDSPVIDNLLQVYSSYSSRIGIPSVPSDVVSRTIKDISRD